MHAHSIKQLADALSHKEISSVELTRLFLERIGAHKELNAFITVDAEKALAQAENADKLLATGEGSLLTGIPVAHKDIFCTQGTLTTCGSRMLHNFVAPYNATVVSNLERVGAVMLGKTNMDEFAMGSSNENSYFGVVKNPWAPDRVPGGSSGGSAAAVAARLVPAASGTDTGGSIRQPAALCGITGLKPTYGRVSRYGMVAFASSLDQGGPMTQNAEDAALMLAAMAGFDPKDSTSAEREVADYRAGLNTPIRGLRIGVPKTFFGAGLDDEVGTVVEQAIREFEALGATVREVELPASRLAVPCYYVLAPAEASSNLSRYDGVRYGYRAPEYSDLIDMYMRTRAEGFGDEVKRRIMIGTYALSAGYYDAYYLKALKLRRLIAEDFQNAFGECDVLMGPTTPTSAFPIGANVEDPVAMYLNDIYTIPVNLAGLPAISVPAGFDEHDLPVGLQIIGQYFDEARLLNIAHQFQQATDWHTRIPEGYA